MAASITWTPNSQTPAQPALSLQAAARTAEHLRATLMGLAPSARPEPHLWPRSRAASTALVDVREAAPRVAILAPPPWSERGLRLLYDAPRRGTSDSRVNFIHPKDAGGVLVELMQKPDADHH